MNPWIRLAVQVAAACLFVLGSGLAVRTLGDPLGTGIIELSGLASYLFTLLITIAAINAFNMLDGLDGLAGGLAVIALAAVAYLASGGGLTNTAAASLMFIGAIVGFLVFNFPTRHNSELRCFMGDAGSTLLGFVIACLSMRVSQKADAVASPVTVLWLVALPLYELVWTTARRVMQGQSPLRGDSRHFHHLLLKAGFGIRSAFAVLVSLAAFLATCGIAAQRFGIPDALAFAGFAVAGVGVVSLMYRADLLLRLIPLTLRPVPPLDAPSPTAANDESPPERLAA